MLSWYMNNFDGTYSVLLNAHHVVEVLVGIFIGKNETVAGIKPSERSHGVLLLRDNTP